MVSSLFILSGCTDQKSNNKEIIDINITKALENKKDLLLSELVEDVEILKLESNSECFMNNPAWMLYFGKKHILFFDLRKTQLFLFNRDGTFLRRIGKKGKGPGEYNGELIGTMSKDEKRIIISDRFSAARVIVYNLMGEMILQKDLSEYIPTQTMEMSCDYDNLISFLPGRPFTPADGFSSVILFDLELNKVSEVLPRLNDENLLRGNLVHAELLSSKEGTFFWEMYRDTIFQYYEDGSSFPRFKFTVDKNFLTKQVMTGGFAGRELYEYTFPLFIHFLPGYIQVSISSNRENVYYNLKTGESFSTNIKNDIYGINPRFYAKVLEQDLIVDKFDWVYFTEPTVLEQIRKMEVSHPEIRDELLMYAEDPPEDLGPVLILMHMK